MIPVLGSAKPVKGKTGQERYLTLYRQAMPFGNRKIILEDLYS